MMEDGMLDMVMEARIGGWGDQFEADDVFEPVRRRPRRADPDEDAEFADGGDDVDALEEANTYNGVYAADELCEEERE